MLTSKRGVVLVAEDDEDYFVMAKIAFEQFSELNDLHHVKDGEELMDYLLLRNQYQSIVAPLV